MLGTSATATKFSLRPAITIGFVVLLALVAWATWFYEVVAVKKWDGLNWLIGFPHAAVVGVVCVAAAMLLVQIARGARPSWWKGAAFVVITAALSLLAFSVAREALYLIHGRMLLLRTTYDVALRNFSVAMLLITGALALFVVLAARVLIARITLASALYFVAAIALVMPASLMTIHLFPALNGHTDYLHAVKMGYPLFWTVVLFAIASLCARTTTPAPIA